MIDVNELRKGVTFEIDGNLLKVLDYEHNKSGRGNASIRIKARNLRTGATFERTFTSGNRVQDVALEFQNVNYLYSDGDFYYFMNNETFDQPAVPAKVLVDAAISGSTDKLVGVNENLIVGRLIPAGTGNVLRALRRVAAQNDKEIMEMKQQAQEQKALAAGSETEE